MDLHEPLNMTMLCDFYELTMGNGYFDHGLKDRITYFDVFFRQVPDGGGVAIAAGLEQVIDYINNLHFSEADIAYLRSPSAPASSSARSFWSICARSASPAISGRCPRARRCSRASRS